jgi:NADH dehydrogenase
MPASPILPKRRVVIVGAGFGGLAAAKALGKESRIELTVIDRHNHHLFQPLLYQVATAGLSPADIASPIRSILRRQVNTRVMLAEVYGIDLDRKEVLAEDRRIPYDDLVIATGARHAYFGHEEWARYAPGLKGIDDATYLRRRILVAFERAEIAEDEAKRGALLTFVVVGGGPTGVEMAGAIAELAKMALSAEFRTIDPGSARIILIEAAERLLSGFDPALSEKARQFLAELGIEVHLGGSVTRCDAEGVTLGESRIDAATIIWAAGVMASPAGEWISAGTDRVGRVKVLPDLSVPGHRDVFVLGDAAHVEDARGRALPGVAPVAKQQGEYVASLLIARVKGKDLPPFRYRDLGMLATIGRKRAVVQMGRFKISGYMAWLIWSMAHIYFLIGFRNRLSVVLNWGWNYLTFQRGTRLITGLKGSRLEGMAEPPAAPPTSTVRQKAARQGSVIPR